MESAELRSDWEAYVELQLGVELGPRALHEVQSSNQPVSHDEGDEVSTEQFPHFDAGTPDRLQQSMAYMVVPAARPDTLRQTRICILAGTAHHNRTLQ